MSDKCKRCGIAGGSHAHCANDLYGLLHQVNHVAGLDDYRPRMKRARALMDPYFTGKNEAVPSGVLAKLKLILNNDEKNT